MSGSSFSWENRGTATGDSRSATITGSYGGYSDSTSVSQSANTITYRLEVSGSPTSFSRSGGSGSASSTLVRYHSSGGSSSTPATSSTSWSVSGDGYSMSGSSYSVGQNNTGAPRYGEVIGSFSINGQNPSSSFALSQGY